MLSTSTQDITFDSLVSNTTLFQNSIIHLPTKSNQISTIAGTDLEKQNIILSHAKAARIIGKLVFLAIT